MCRSDNLNIDMCVLLKFLRDICYVFIFASLLSYVRIFFLICNSFYANFE